MIEGKFEYTVGAKAVRLSHRDFGLVVQTLHHAAGDEFLSSEVVEDQLAMLTQRACDLLHRLDAGTQSLAAPFIEELAGPGGRVVIPELLEGFFEQVSADGFQV